MADSTEKILEKILGNKDKADHIIERIPIDKIIASPAQARKIFDQKKLNELAQSIAAIGVLEPILVRRLGPTEENFGLIAGERRVRASKLAGETSIPAIIMEITSERDLRLLGLAENVQREDLSYIEKMYAIAELHDEFDNNDNMANKLGLSTRTIERYIKAHRDLTSLPDIMQYFVNDPVNADFAALKAISELAPDIRRIEKRDKREYSRILIKFQKKGIKATLDSLKKRFFGKNELSEKHSSSEHPGFIETDNKIHLQLVIEKNKPVLPDNFSAFKGAIDAFIDAARRLNKKFEDDGESDSTNMLRMKGVNNVYQV